MTAIKYRHLSRDSAHRKALLRNLVTSLVEHESITTTWHKAKEAQRQMEKLITLGKKNTNATRAKAREYLFEEHTHLPKVFGELARRYANRPGGYTRVLRIESHKDDAAQSAILSLVDGPKDMRFAMTAKVLAREQALGGPTPELTATNVRKVTRFRENGEEDLAREVKRLQIVAGEEAEEEAERFEKDGTQLQWMRGPGRKAGPGRVVKRPVDSRVPGEDPVSFKRRFSQTPKKDS